MLDLNEDLAERIADSRLAEEVKAAADAGVADSLCRLAAAMSEPLPLPFLGRHIKREIIFPILCGSCGAQFLQSVLNVQNAGEIYREARKNWEKDIRRPCQRRHAGGCFFARRNYRAGPHSRSSQMEAMSSA